MSNPDGPKDSSPFVKCTKHGTCRLNCRSSCNTRKLINPPPPLKEAPTSMNTKDRRAYQRNQSAALRYISKARNAVAELDAITHGQKPAMLHSNVRDLRELLSVTFGMTLSTRLELWDDFGAVKPSDHPAGRGKGGLAARSTTGRTAVDPFPGEHMDGGCP